MAKRLPYHDLLHAEIRRERDRLWTPLMLTAAHMCEVDPFETVYDTLYMGLQHACDWFPGAGYHEGQRFQ